MKIGIMRNISLIILASLLSLPIKAQNRTITVTQKKDSVVYKTSFYFEKDLSWSFYKMDSYEIMRLVLWVKDNRAAKIRVVGWSDATGSQSKNEELSNNRALTAQRYLVKEGISARKITYEGRGPDTSVSTAEARRADIYAYIEVETPFTAVLRDTTPTHRRTEEPPTSRPQELRPEHIAPEPKPTIEEPRTDYAERYQEESTPTVEESAPTQAPTVVEPTPSTLTKAVDITFHTNLLYLSRGLFNVGAEWKPNIDLPIGVVLNMGYSPFGSKNWEHSLGGWFISAQGRYYMPMNESLFAGVNITTGGYNIKTGDTGYQGNITSVGIMGGYKVTISPAFDLEFTLGVGFGWMHYDTYYHEDGYNVEKQMDINRSCIVPTSTGITLIWKIL